MKTEITSASFSGQESTLESTLNTAPRDEEHDEAGAWGAAALSRLSFCIAWLFGLEAFFADPGTDNARSRTWH